MVSANVICMVSISIIYGVVTYFIIVSDQSKVKDITAFQDTCCHYDSFRRLGICEKVIPKHYDTLDDDAIYAYCSQNPPTDVWEVLWLAYGTVVYVMLMGCNCWLLHVSK